MDPNLLHLAVAAVLTVVCVIITALIWRRAQVKTVFWWIGLTLVPMAVHLAGLSPAVAGAVDTLRAWWGSLQFTPIEWVGLVLGGLAALLMLGSRLIPSESAKDRRQAAREDRAARKGTGAGPAARPVTAGRPGPQPPASTPRPQGGSTNANDAEFDEIAELLRKRGIN